MNSHTAITRRHRMRHRLMLGVSLLAAGPACAAVRPVHIPSAPVAATSATSPPPSSPPANIDWQQSQSFVQLGQNGDMMLSGLASDGTINFMLRRDRIGTQASLQLEFTPSPALTPGLSQLQIFLNDQLADVIPFRAEDLGRHTSRQILLDPRLLANFNHLRFHLIGHYSNTCELSAHSSLWVAIGQNSELQLAGSSLDMRNDLAFLPLPFFDPDGGRELRLPVVLPARPNALQIQASAVASSYFAQHLGWWRASHMQALYARLPAEGNALVLMDNAERRQLLPGLEDVDAPTVEMLDRPDHLPGKILLLTGRDDSQVLVAAQVLASGSNQFRGHQVRIDSFQLPPRRKPYDAPTWVQTQRPVSFGELVSAPYQLQASGIASPQVNLSLNLPPDLFVWGDASIPMKLHTRVSPPPARDQSSWLEVKVNNQIISTLAMQDSDSTSFMNRLRLPLVSRLGELDRNVPIPALEIGSRNLMQFRFDINAQAPAAGSNACAPVNQPLVQAEVLKDSSLDLSGYQHYIGLPNLGVFAQSGFPFSRQADLADTIAVMPAHPGEADVSTLLSSINAIVSETGYPALRLQVSTDLDAAIHHDADLLVIGAQTGQLEQSLPMELRLRGETSRLRNAQPGSIQRAQTQAARGAVTALGDAGTSSITASGDIAGVVQIQAPYFKQRSIVVLEASAGGGQRLLQSALDDPTQRSELRGSATLLRDSGASPQFTGVHYYVGHLSWWALLWFHFSNHPLILGSLAALLTLIAAGLLWRVLRWQARRRLDSRV